MKWLKKIFSIGVMVAVLGCLYGALRCLTIDAPLWHSIFIALFSVLGLINLEGFDPEFLDKYVLGKKFYSIFCHVYATFILVIAFAIVIAWMSTPSTVVISIPILFAVMGSAIFARALWHHMRKKKQ